MQRVNRHNKFSKHERNFSGFEFNIFKGIKINIGIFRSKLRMFFNSWREPQKRAVGFKLSEGLEVPKELEEKFKIENRIEYALTAE